MMSAAESAAIEIGDLVGARFPAQNFIPVRKTPKAADRVEMDLGELDAVLVAVVAVELQAQFLIGQFFVTNSTVQPQVFSKPALIARRATSSACASVANARGVLRNMLRGN